MTETGNIRGRLGMAYQDNRYSTTSPTGTSNWYGSLEFDLTPDTQLTVGGSYQKAQGVAGSRRPAALQQRRRHQLPRRTAFVTSWDTVDETTRQAYLKLEHAFNADWVWTTDLTWMDLDRDANSLFANGGIDPLTGDDGARWLHYPAKTGLERKAINTYLKGSVDPFGRNHDVLLGADYAHSKGYTVQRWGNDNFAPFNIFDFTRPDDTGKRRQQDRRQHHREIRLLRHDPVVVERPDETHPGGRLSSYRYHDLQVFQNDDGSFLDDSRLPSFRTNDKLTPYAGLTYDLNEQWTAYVSYAETHLQTAVPERQRPAAGHTAGCGHLEEPRTGHQRPTA